MAEVLVLEFETATASELYQQVNGILGIDSATGKGDWPPGILSHLAGVTEDGQFIVVESWESQAAQEKFMSERLGPALGQANAPEPRRVQWFTGLGEKR